MLKDKKTKKTVSVKNLMYKLKKVQNNDMLPDISYFYTV